jgi:hypothetical protein
MPTHECYEIMVTLAGKTFCAIEIAANQLRQRGRDVEKYAIVVSEADPAIAFDLTGVRARTIFVSFQDPDQPASLVGSGPNLIGFSVSLNADTLEVTTLRQIGCPCHIAQPPKTTTYSRSAPLPPGIFPSGQQTAF